MPKHLHPISDADRAAMATTRESLKASPAIELTPAMRPFFDEMTRQVPLARRSKIQRRIITARSIATSTSTARR